MKNFNLKTIFNENNPVFKAGQPVILYFLLFVSMLPVIAWWAGLIGLIYFIYRIFRFVYPDKVSLHSVIAGTKSFKEKTTGKLTLYIILFGIIIHGACRIHSEILVQNLYNEAKSEKNIIIGSLKK